MTGLRKRIEERYPVDKNMRVSMYVPDLEDFVKSYAKELCKRVVGEDEDVSHPINRLDKLLRNQMRDRQRRVLAEEIER